MFTYNLGVNIFLGEEAKVCLWVSIEVVGFAAGTIGVGKGLFSG